MRKSVFGATKATACFAMLTCLPAVAMTFDKAKCLVDGRWANCNVSIQDQSVTISLLPLKTKTRQEGPPTNTVTEVIQIPGESISEYAYLNQSDLKSNVPVVVLGAVLLPFTFGLSADALAAKESKHEYIYAIKLNSKVTKSQTIIVELHDFQQSKRFYPYIREATGLDMGIKR